MLPMAELIQGKKPKTQQIPDSFFNWICRERGAMCYLNFLAPAINTHCAVSPPCYGSALIIIQMMKLKMDLPLCFLVLGAALVLQMGMALRDFQLVPVVHSGHAGCLGRVQLSQT